MAKRRRHPAVIFLWAIAVLTMVFIAGAGLFRYFEKDLLRWAMIPSADFHAVPLPVGADYRQPRLWIARPDIVGNPASWVPPGLHPTAGPRVSVFFIHPTSFLDRSAWNAPIDDRDSRVRAALFVRSQASAFNSIGAVWAPRYRQATFGAFLTDADNARRALDFAYRDVLAAYQEFLREAPSDRPIILAAHSQGSAHLVRLLRERVRGAPEAARIVAVYAIGWPISVTADLPALPFPACQRPDQAACIIAWQSFAEPADPSQITDVYDDSRGATGALRAGTQMLCTNPLTGMPGGTAPAGANLGTLVPDEDMTQAQLWRGAVGARCGPRGLLLIGEVDTLPPMGNYALPGNNYHVYDYALFWANLRADAERRLAAFEAARR
jgi:hypothetical protein